MKFMSAHSWKLTYSRYEWKRLVTEEATETPPTTSAVVPDKPLAEGSHQRTTAAPNVESGISSSETTRKEIVAQAQSNKINPGYSDHAKPLASARQTKEKGGSKKFAVNMAKNRGKSGKHNQSDDEVDDAVSRDTKRQKPNNEADFVTVHSVDRNSDWMVKPNRPNDSYRPSYQSNQPMFSNGQSGPIIQPQPRPNTPYHADIHRGPQIPEVLDTRPQQSSGARTPHPGPQRSSGAQILHPGQKQPPNQKGAGQHATKQSLQQNAPRGPKNHNAQPLGPKQACGAKILGYSQVNQRNQAQDSGAKTASYSQASQPNQYQTSGAKTPGYSQATSTFQPSGARTPAYSQSNRFNQASRPRTSAYTTDTTPINVWRAKTPRPDQQRGYSHSFSAQRDRQPPFYERGATGGTHRFDREDEDGGGFFAAS
jgi:hypothetical protein